MKKIIVLIIVLAILVFPTSFSAIAYEKNKSMVGPELHVGVFGASFFGGLGSTGFVITNYGDAPILNIHWTFSIKSVSNNDIDISYSNELESLVYNEGYVFTTKNITGFGPVTLSISATTSNAGEATDTTYGFQIGHITLSKTYVLAWY